MLQGFKDFVRAVAAGFGRLARGVAAALLGARVFIVLALAFAAAGYAIYRHPPLKSVTRGELGIRVNRLTGEVEETRDSSVNGKNDELAKRCTYGHVWTASAVVNGDASALALAVQPADAWRELWLFHKTKKGWSVRVLPPAAIEPGVGTAEFAGWAPGKVRVTREAIVAGKVTRRTQLVGI